MEKITIELNFQQAELIKSMMEQITEGEISFSRFPKLVAEQIINKIEESSK